MKLTEFGKMIRKYRIENSMLLKDMSDMLGLSSSYLCALETGTKDITSDFEDRLFSKIKFSSDEKAQLQKAIDHTRSRNFKISSDETELDKELVGAFCRKHTKLSDIQKRDILRILREANIE